MLRDWKMLHRRNSRKSRSALQVWAFTFPGSTPIFICRRFWRASWARNNGWHRGSAKPEAKREAQRKKLRPGLMGGLVEGRREKIGLAEHNLALHCKAASNTLMAKTKITALIHAQDNERSLGRALDSLRPCDEVIVVDHGSKHETAKVAREHGAKVISG